MKIELQLNETKIDTRTILYITQMAENRMEDNYHQLKDILYDAKFGTSANGFT